MSIRGKVQDGVVLRLMFGWRVAVLPIHVALVCK